MQDWLFSAQNSADTYSLHTARWCDDAQGLLDLQAPAGLRWSPEQLQGQAYNLWRYRDTFPLAQALSPVSYQEGFTPLLPILLEGRQVLFKADYLFPSGSYKDRGATLLLSYAQHLGVRSVVQDSSGNAGSAVAMYAALAGISCEIFVPESTSEGKLAQIRAFGASLHKVAGSREDTATAALAAAQDTFYASHVWHPMFYQGTKTFAYELCEQRSWQAPDVVVLPAGNGTLLIGAYLGFAELLRWGIIKQMPRLVGVQAAYCAPLYYARQGLPMPHTQPTLAEGIAIAAPRRAAQMLAILEATNGDLVVVSEDEIKYYWQTMARRGHYIEPTSAAVVAGVAQWITQNRPSPQVSIASVLTGSGLKTGGKSPQ
ncbi:threonine synthase [Eisenibacter elegans]|jgi:threonine synthase|uniref:threonine synthase n=1 Tax=Eisenibacter elegans TaxID=997 RepID=UPI00042A2939|nr:threonine synthase [Eisenibacter elegans]